MSASAHCIQSPESSPEPALSKKERDELVSRAVREVEESRRYIAELEKRLGIYEEQLAAERGRVAAGNEVDARQQERIKLTEQQVALLNEAVAKQREIAKELETRLVFMIGERDKALRRGKVWLAFGIALGVCAVIVVDNLTGED